MAGRTQVQTAAARWLTRWTWSASAGRCWWCATWCWVRNASPTCWLGPPGASADVLTQRLRERPRRGGIADDSAHRGPLGVELTPWGAQLAPVLVGLAQWASRSPRMRYDAPLGTDSLMLSLKALFDAPAAADLDATIAVHLGDERFQLHIADGELTVTRGGNDEPDATIDTDQTTLLSLLRSERPLDDILASGNLRLAGNRQIVERFRRLFPLPQPIPIAGRT